MLYSYEKNAKLSVFEGKSVILTSRASKLNQSVGEIFAGLLLCYRQSVTRSMFFLYCASLPVTVR